MVKSSYSITRARYVSDELLYCCGLQVRNALFLVRLEESEDEYPLGLAVRTFNVHEDDVANGKVQVRWYQRKSTRHSWGSQTAFKFASVFTNRRQPVPWVATITISSILAIPVVLTPASISKPAEPVLTRDCMSFVRSHMLALAESGEWVRDE
eukprot:2245135-Pleurochrysis_carterae.AAC.1